MKKYEMPEKCRWCLCRFLIAEVYPQNTTARGCPVCNIKAKEATGNNENIS